MGLDRPEAVTKARTRNDEDSSNGLEKGDKCERYLEAVLDKTR